MAAVGKSKTSELVNTDFPLTAKLMLLCSPIFLSLPHGLRLLTMQNLSELRQHTRLPDMLQYLFTEVTYSIVSFPGAFLADSSVGVPVLLMSVLSISWLPAVSGSLAYVSKYFSVEIRIKILEFSISFIGFLIVASVIERAYFARQMSLQSPKFRTYCFLCYYLSNVWQLVHALFIYVPRMFPDFYKAHREIVGWISLAFNFTLWAFVTIVYGFIAYVRRGTDSTTDGISYKVVVCMYLAISCGFKSLLTRLRWLQYPYRDIFEACERWYPREIVVMMKHMFRLFTVCMCLMFLFGLELILRALWFHQDTSLYRTFKSSMWTAFPLEMILLLYVMVVYPFIEFCGIPFFKKKLHVPVTDLRLLGAAVVFYNLSFIATMSLEWMILSSKVSSPNEDAISIRIYNCMLSPISWTISHPEMTPVGISIPGRMSRMFLTDVIGVFLITLNSTVLNIATSFNMTWADSKVFFVRGNRLDTASEIESQLMTAPKYLADDSHLFVLNGLVNASKEYLVRKNVQVTVKSANEPVKSYEISSNVTHVLLDRGVHDISLSMGKAKFQMQLKMNDHGVYSLMFYDSWSGSDNGYELEVLSEGIVLSRLWAHIQVLFLAIGMSLSYIPMVQYTYRNAPHDLLATCFAFQRCGRAFSTSIIWFIFNKFGLGPGPSTIGMMVVVMFTVFFFFVAVSEIIPDNDPAGGNINAESYDDALSVNSGSLKFRSALLIRPPETQTVAEKPAAPPPSKLDEGSSATVKSK